MPYATLRRVLVPPLDRRVLRGTMQISNATAMQQLYISRADIEAQWVVISNPSMKNINLTHYTLTDETATRVFHFPKGYILQSGEEVTVWCVPGTNGFNSNNLLDPYLLWTSLDGALSSSPFFLRSQHVHEVLLVDGYLTEVASLQLTSNGQKTFRVNSATPQPLSYPYLNSFHFERSHGVYIFSRYWGVVSDPAYSAHFAAVAFTPVIEVARILLMYCLLAQVYLDPTGLNPLLLLLAGACDMASRFGSLYIKDGQLATFLSFSAFTVDQFQLMVIYQSLSVLYPSVQGLYSTLLTVELTLNLISLAGTPAHFFTRRRAWHRIYRLTESIIYRFPTFVTTCYVGKELFFFLLHLKAASPLFPPLVISVVLYLCIPLVVLSTTMTISRGISIAVHLLTFHTSRKQKVK
ncbi:hypothetical protein LEN26_006450 [Aphanomyces euteiches]|nr:hypothetical protein AeMF1_010062 [Aphanomyces euteiches]KAH9135363.1 hypothetical protein LEN26_006450 [Aphanomyces euteiches]KAH9194022.1 hypothetical protein AeNC1_003994 [Aphanomyces euteiches]